MGFPYLAGGIRINIKENRALRRNKKTL